MKRLDPQPMFSRIWHLYADGFRDLSDSGRKLWIIILIKLFILFVVLKMFLMPDILKKNYQNDTQRSKHVLENLTDPVAIDSKINPKP